MTNPFKNRALSPAGPVTDIVQITPDDATDLPQVATSLYVENGGTLAITTVAGAQRNLTVADFSFLPVGVVRVHATGTAFGLIE